MLSAQVGRPLPLALDMITFHLALMHERWTLLERSTTSCSRTFFASYQGEAARIRKKVCQGFYGELPRQL